MSTSGAYQYATGEGGIGLDAMNENIRKFLAGSPTEEATRAAMSQYGVSEADIQRATGKSLADYYPGVLPAASTAVAPISTTPLDTVAPNLTRAIQNWFDSGKTAEESLQAMSVNNITDADIKAATGSSFQDIYGVTPEALQTQMVQPYVDSGGASQLSPLSSLSTGATYTEDRYNPNDPASSHYIADPNAGQYVFDPMTGGYALAKKPTFTDIYVPGGGEQEGSVLTATQQQEAYDKEQARLAALNPTQRAIEQARYTVSGEGSDTTAYNPVTALGSSWAVSPDGQTLTKMSDDQSGLGKNQYRYDVLDAATGKVTQQIGIEGNMLQNFLRSPMPGLLLNAFLPGAGTALGSVLGLGSGALASAVGSGVINLGMQIGAGVDPKTALRNSVLSAGAGALGSQLSSMLPNELGAVGKSAVQQLVTTGSINPTALLTSAGADAAASALASETGMNKSDALRIVNAGLQFMSGNELGAVTSLATGAMQQAFADAKRAGATDAEAMQAAKAVSGEDFSETGVRGIDPRISGQGVGGSSLTDPRYFEGQGGDLIEAGYIAPPKIPGLSLGQQEQLVGSAVYAPLRDIDEEGNETTYAGLRQQVQMMDANGQPVLDAAGKPIIYEALYDPKDGSIRYSVKVGDDDTRLAQGSNLLSQKPQIGFDDEGNRVLFNPVNNRVIAVLEATSDAPVSGTKLDDLAATDSQLDDITFAALEGLRQGAEAGDGELSVEGGETVDLLDPTKKPGEGLSDLDTIVLDGKQPGDTAEKPGGDTGGKPGDKDGKPGGANDGLGTDTLPGAGADTLPGEGADTLPGSGADTLPGEGADTLPGDGADTLPGDGADMLPGAGADTLPG